MPYLIDMQISCCINKDSRRAVVAYDSVNSRLRSCSTFLVMKSTTVVSSAEAPPNASGKLTWLALGDYHIAPLHQCPQLGQLVIRPFIIRGQNTFLDAELNQERLSTSAALYALPWAPERCAANRRNSIDIPRYSQNPHHPQIH